MLEFCFKNKPLHIVVQRLTTRFRRLQNNFFVYKHTPDMLFYFQKLEEIKVMKDKAFKTTQNKQTTPSQPSHELESDNKDISEVKPTENLYRHKKNIYDSIRNENPYLN